METIRNKMTVNLESEVNYLIGKNDIIALYSVQGTQFNVQSLQYTL